MYNVSPLGSPGEKKLEAEASRFSPNNMGEEPIQLHIKIYMLSSALVFCFWEVVYLTSWVLGFKPRNMVIIKNHGIVVTQVLRFVPRF